MNHIERAVGIHARNQAAGWWTNLSTGEPLDRNIGELLCLVHSEISEAWEGYCRKTMDDHLPQYRMFDVEIADTRIRVYDILGSYFCNLDVKFLASDWEIPFHTTSVGDYFNAAHYCVSNSMEGFRKGNKIAGQMYLFRLLDLLDFMSNFVTSDKAEEVLEAKLAYNAQRADHKPENRKLEDGKKF